MRVLLPGRDYFPPRVLLRGGRPIPVALRAGRGDGEKRKDGPAKRVDLPVAGEAVLPRGAGAGLGGVPA